jgi:NitT/TauT family transport system permease protein
MVPLINRPMFVRAAAPIAVGVIITIAWEAFCKINEVPSYLFPAPSDIATTLAKDWPDLLHALWSTLRITFQAFFLAVILGTLAAFLFVQSKLIEISLFPYAVLLQVTPIVAVAPLIIILVKNTDLALTICATVIALFPVIANTTTGLRSVDPGLLSFFRMNKASRLDTLVRLRIPSAVVAEFVAGTGGRSAGLAYEILQSSFQLDIPRMFAALLLIAVAGIVLFLAMVGLTRLLLGGWHDSAIREDA